MKKSSLFAMLAALALSVSAPVLADDGDAHKAEAAAKDEGKPAAAKKGKAKKGKAKVEAKKADEKKAEGHN